MKRNIALILLCLAIVAGCQNPKKKVDKLEIAKQYYEALDNSDGLIMKELLADTLFTVETDYDYEQYFTREGYVESWLRWDSVFAPTYKVLDIEQDQELVKATISKSDKRILFLHNEPTVWDEILQFDGVAIARIARRNVTFNDTLWVQNVNALLAWIDANHPELNGFINDQTRTGGMNYLKAIELYENRE